MGLKIVESRAADLPNSLGRQNQHHNGIKHRNAQKRFLTAFASGRSHTSHTCGLLGQIRRFSFKPLGDADLRPHTSLSFRTAVSLFAPSTPFSYFEEWFGQSRQKEELLGTTADRTRDETRCDERWCPLERGVLPRDEGSVNSSRRPLSALQFPA